MQNSKFGLVYSNKNSYNLPSLKLFYEIKANLVICLWVAPLKLVSDDLANEPKPTAVSRNRICKLAE